MTSFVKNTFIDKDSGYRTIMSSFKASKGRAVFVGFLRSSGEYDSKSHPTVATIAAIHEFGSADGSIPERSFMRSAVDDNKKMIEKLIDKLVLKVAEGRFNEIGGLRILGAKVQSLMRNQILKGIPPANSPATIRRKGSSIPLIDTGTMIGSLDFEVIDAKGKSGGVA